MNRRRTDRVIVKLAGARCTGFSSASRSEWLVTNGIGGYASGTVAGISTRSYHGLLVAALDPPVARRVRFNTLDATVEIDGERYPLGSRSTMDDRAGAPAGGHRYLEQFHLEGAIPVWVYSFGLTQLTRQIWMEYGANTTYIRFEHCRGSAPVRLSIECLVNDRDHHLTTDARRYDAMDTFSSCRFDADGHRQNGVLVKRDEEPLLALRSDRFTLQPANEWRSGFRLLMEEARGCNAVDDRYRAATGAVELDPGGSVTLMASTDIERAMDTDAAYRARRAYDQRVVARSLPPHGAPDAIRQLLLAADQFVVARSRSDGRPGRTVIAGYHWFEDWGRDTMIALPGLALATGRYALAKRILTNYADHIDGGLLPNRFPDTDTAAAPAYNTADATLWYFEALRAYYDATADAALIGALFWVLASVIDAHLAGTRYGIRVDPDDGLLAVGEGQLTWMDAKVDEWVVTPRVGKPVEINALWYNALRVMERFAGRLDADASRYRDLAARTEAHFSRFWNRSRGCLFDVIDGTTGSDASLRPNQLFAVSLFASPLSHEKQRAVVDSVARSLLTPYGLRTLAPTEPAYRGRYGGARRARDAAYHQGTVWPWLIGPFVRAHLRVYRDPSMARGFLTPLLDEVDSCGLGTVGELYDGDAPHRPRGCIAQAWSVAEVLRCWQLIASGTWTREFGSKRAE